MNFKNEKQLLLTIRYTLPILILLLSIAITTFLYIENNTDYEEVKKDIESRFIKDKKQVILEQVENIYEYTITEQKRTEENLRKSLFSRTNEAYNIAMNIYKNNPTLDKKTLQKLIIDAIRPIRFNNNRGYFFIYTLDGVSLLNAGFPKIEGKNLWNYQDAKGVFLIQEMNSILKNIDETFYDWYWNKPNDKEKKQYKKIGFFKKFEPFNWFIGTGEYIEDFSKDIQQNVLEQIEKLKFGQNSYFIVTDKYNNYISHINKDLIGKNSLEKLKDINDFKSIKKIEKVINSKKGFVYLDFYKPFSKKISSKIIYLKTIPNWEWVVSTGFYKEDVATIVNIEKEKLSNKYNKNLKNLFMIAILSTIILLLISFYMSRLIEKKFKRYKIDINHHIKDNQKKTELLAQKSKLADMGEMIGNIAHQWRQPLSTITASTSGLKLNKEMNVLDDKYLADSIDRISSSANYLSETIDDFRDFFKPDKEINIFSLNSTIEKSIKMFSSQLENNNITLSKNIQDIEISGFERELIQVLINILKNAKDAFENEQEEKTIFITTKKNEKYALIEIKDNAGGIQEDVLKRIFEPYFTTKHQSQGTGIGLYMSQEIVVRHMKGEINVSNSKFEYKDRKYKGALFTIKLPL